MNTQQKANYLKTQGEQHRNGVKTKLWFRNLHCRRIKCDQRTSHVLNDVGWFWFLNNGIIRLISSEKTALK